MAWFNDHNLAPLILVSKNSYFETITVPRKEEGAPPIYVQIKVETVEEMKSGMEKNTAEELYLIWKTQGYQVRLEPIGGGGWKVVRISETRTIA